ncbi:MAG: hypothetical protein WBA74_26095 [Cyclobacteriaceae bacterium]
MKKVFQIVVIGCMILLCGNSLSARQTNCRASAADALNDASTELEACQEGCPSYGNCASFCQSYYSLSVDNILANYAVCLDGSFA